MEGYHPLGSWKRQIGSKCCTHPYRDSCHQDFKQEHYGESAPCGPACKYWTDTGGITFLSAAECPAGWIDATRFLPKEAGRYLVSSADLHPVIFIAEYSPDGRNCRGVEMRVIHGRPCFYTCVFRGGGRDGCFEHFPVVRYWMPIPSLPKEGARYCTNFHRVSCNYDLKRGICDVFLPCGPWCGHWINLGDITFLSAPECPAGWIDAMRFLPKETGRYLVSCVYGSPVVSVAEYSPYDRDLRDAAMQDIYLGQRFYTCVFRGGASDGCFKHFQTVSHWMPIPPLPEEGAADA